MQKFTQFKFKGYSLSVARPAKSDDKLSTLLITGREVKHAAGL